MRRRHHTIAVGSALAASLAVAAVAAAGPADGRAWADILDVARPTSTPASVIVVFDAAPAAGRTGANAAHAAAIANDAAVAELLHRGIHLAVLRRYTRTLNAVEATVPLAETWALAHAPGVVGVYPVRAIVPASVASDAVAAVGADALPVRSSLPGDGAGIEVAVLDGPVDDTTSALAGRVDRPSPLPLALDQRIFEHGTAVASLVAGAPGPSGLGGVAPGARILAVPVLHPDATGALTGTTADLLAGLETAADPNGDGDLADHVRVVVAAVTAPFAGFSDSPEARAIATLSALGTVVVAAAGNDGPSGTATGTVGSPGAAPDALTVGATDGRGVLPSVAFAIDGLADPSRASGILAGLVAPPSDLALPLRGIVGYARATADAGAVASDYVGPDGTSTVRGAAVLVPRDGGDIRLKAAAAAAAGAAVLVLYGPDAVPAGALGADDGLPLPVVSLTEDVALPAVREIALGAAPTIRFDAVALDPNVVHGAVAPFSSTGLTLDGAVKPDIVLPGVAIATARPVSGFWAISGTSAAAAQAGGLVAILAAAHPSWSSDAIRGALATTATLASLDGVTVAPVVAQGGGVPDVGAASAEHLALGPRSLGLGLLAPGAPSGGWLQVTNLTDAAEVVTLGVQRDGASPDTALDVAVTPSRFILAPNATAHLPVTVTASGPAPAGGVVGGWLVASVPDGPTERVAFAGAYGSAASAPLLAVSAAPQGVDLLLGSVHLDGDGRIGLRAVRLLTVDVYQGTHRVVRAYAARDLLPGRIRLHLRAVDGHGHRLAPGRYRLVAAATDGAGHVETVALDLPWR